MIPSRLREEIETWMREKKYGHLQLNFAGGKILNVNRTESIKIEFLGNVGSVSAEFSSSTDIPQDEKLE